MTRQSAEQVELSTGEQYHIAAGPSDVAEHVLLVGDPERAQSAAARLERVRFRRSHRGYDIVTGLHRGLPLTVMCTGMGAACMEIAVIELSRIIASPTLLRAGSCGALQSDIAPGDLVISQGAVRMENASLGYVEPGFPAYAHAEVQLALVRAAEEAAVPFHVGVTATADGFYGAQGRHIPGYPPRDEHLLERLGRQGVKNLEMETSCLLTLAALRGLRAGAICATYASRTADIFLGDAERRHVDERLLDVSFAALRYLAEMREQRRGRVHWHHGLEPSSVRR